MDTIPTNASMKERALALLKQGISVIPLCAPGVSGHSQEICGGSYGKHPLLKHWTEFQERRPSEAEIESWWTQDPKANLGMICGAVSGNLVVIDIDNYANFEKFLDETGLAIPNTSEALWYATGKGHHIVMRSSKPLRKKKFDDWGEIQGEGTYVVTIGSTHANGGVYGPAKDCQKIKSLPSEWEALLSKKGTQTSKITPPIDTEFTDFLHSMDSLQKGTRTNALIKYGGMLIRKGHTPMETNWVLGIINERAKEPLAVEEFDQTIVPGAYRWYQDDLVKTNRKQEVQETIEEKFAFPMDLLNVKGDFISEWVKEMSKIRQGAPQFWYFGMVQMLATPISGNCRLKTAKGEIVSTTPKMYLINIGETGSGKSTSCEDVDRFFKSVHLDNQSYVVKFSGSGSGEGVINRLFLNPIMLFGVDEFKMLAIKHKQEGNTLFPFMVQLFEQDVVFKNTKQNGKNVALSQDGVYFVLRICSTPEDIKNSLNQGMIDSGFLNRMFPVWGEQFQNNDDKKELDAKTNVNLKSILISRLLKFGSRLPIIGNEPKEPIFIQRSKEAQEVYVSWRKEVGKLKQGIGVRLDSYYVTLEIVLSASRDSLIVTKEIALDILKIMDYAVKNRQKAWGVCHVDTVTEMAKKILALVYEEPGIYGRNKLYNKVNAWRRPEIYAQAIRSTVGFAIELHDDDKKFWPIS